MSKVIANGLVVAHSNSGHIAHVLPPGDIRLVPPVPTPTPLWNQVASSKVFLNYPMMTKFESGLIWVDGTKVGPLSDPTDGFPTPKGAVNSYACGQGSSGSQNVLVESKKVFRFTDMTWQNQYNSPGIINDAAGAARAKAEFDEAQKKNAPVVDGDGGSGSDGAADGETGKDDEAGETTPPTGDAPVPETCEVAEVTLVDQLDKVTRTLTIIGSSGFFKTKTKRNRSPNPAAPAADESTIQVLDGSTVKLTAKLGTTLCGADKANHAAAHWKLPDGTSKAGAEIEWKANRTGAPTAAGGATEPSGAWEWFTQNSPIRDMFRLADENPVENVITCACCKGTKTRKILVFPKKKPKVDLPFKMKELFKHKFETIVKGPLSLKGEVKVGGSVKLKAEAAWEEESDYTCTFGVAATIEGKLLSAELRARFSFFQVPWPIPVLGQIIRVVQALNDICDWLCGRELITTYFDIRWEGEVNASVGVQCKKAYRGSLVYDKTKAAVTGKHTVTFALGISSLEETGGGSALARAEANATVEASQSGEITFGAGPKLGIKSSITLGPVTLNLLVSWDLLILVPKPGPANPDAWFWQRWGRAAWDWTKDKGAKTAEGVLKATTGYGFKGEKSWSVRAMDARVFELAWVELG